MYMVPASFLDQKAVTAGTGCQGNIFKASVSTYRTKRGFGQTVRFTRSARLSCPGCANCGWELEAISEISQDWPVLGIEEAKDGAFYGLELCSQSRDWETGLIDGWDLQISPYQPATEQTT